MANACVVDAEYRVKYDTTKALVPRAVRCRSLCGFIAGMLLLN